MPLASFAATWTLQSTKEINNDKSATAIPDTCAPLPRSSTTGSRQPAELHDPRLSRKSGFNVPPASGTLPIIVNTLRDATEVAGAGPRTSSRGATSTSASHVLPLVVGEGDLNEAFDNGCNLAELEGIFLYRQWKRRRVESSPASSSHQDCASSASGAACDSAAREGFLAALCALGHGDPQAITEATSVIIAYVTSVPAAFSVPVLVLVCKRFLCSGGLQVPHNNIDAARSVSGLATAAHVVLIAILSRRISSRALCHSSHADTYGRPTPITSQVSAWDDAKAVCTALGCLVTTPVLTTQLPSIVRILFERVYTSAPPEETSEEGLSGSCDALLRTFEVETTLRDAQVFPFLLTISDQMLAGTSKELRHECHAQIALVLGDGVAPATPVQQTSAPLRRLMSYQSYLLDQLFFHHSN